MDVDVFRIKGQGLSGFIERAGDVEATPLPVPEEPPLHVDVAVLQRIKGQGLAGLGVDPEGHPDFQVPLGQQVGQELDTGFHLFRPGLRVSQLLV